MRDTVLFKIICLACMILIVPAEDVPTAVPNLASKTNTRPRRKYSCEECKQYIGIQPVKKTAKSSNDEIDAEWEEEKKYNYKTGEISLDIISDKLCAGIGSAENECRALNIDDENILKKLVDLKIPSKRLYFWMCVVHFRSCCMNNEYGHHCDTCGDCHNNGVCKGNGTRKGNGKCACHAGYAGDYCTECASKYHEAYKDGKHVLCSPCHAACDDSGCTAAGPRGCRVCAKGWIMDPEKGGCIDIDECIKNPCGSNQLCINKDGSHMCLECDKSCNGCTGDGPDLCIKCAEGHEIRNGLCTDLTSENSDKYVTFTRYMTYLGLCIATCIVLQSSTWLAALIGLFVAVYISISEYWLKSLPPNTLPNIL